MKQLSRDEMKKVMGGENPAYCAGGCTGSTGEWIYLQSVNGFTCLQDIHTYCSSDAGYCTSC